MKLWLPIKEGLNQIVYPEVCLGCGQAINSNLKHYLCDYCAKRGFALADSGTQDSILPAHVTFRQALWKFDAGGRLQHILHHLKYYRMPDLGYELGQLMGKAFSDLIKEHLHDPNDQSIIIPIPLHLSKYRKRGYNQARKLASGMAHYLDLPLLPKGHVIRNRNTSTQTGFNMRQRLKNVAGAFEVENEHYLTHRIAIIVDDVFTTGSTTFELARTLLEAGTKECLIMTLAEA